jgi:hypothetical protein
MLNPVSTIKTPEKMLAPAPVKAGVTLSDIAKANKAAKITPLPDIAKSKTVQNLF